MPVLPSYRNQSVDLLPKSIDWFLCEGNIGTQWVKAQLKQTAFRKIIKISYVVKVAFLLYSKYDRRRRASSLPKNEQLLSNTESE